MKTFPLSCERDDYQRLLRHLAAREWPAKVILAGPENAKWKPGDQALWMDADARFNLVLKGRARYAISRNGIREEQVLKPGQLLYWPPHAWNISFWDSPCLFFGIVFRKTFTRYLMADHPGGGPPKGKTLWSWHSRRSMGGTGLHLIRALNTLASERDPDPVLARRLALALLTCVEQHLVENGGEDEGGAARKIWQAALEHLNRHYADPMLSRESVAAAVGVHPNYLSAISIREGGGFHATMEGIRIERARYLLEKGGINQEEVARQCGYSGTVAFSRAFRRATGATPGSLKPAAS